MTRQSELPKYSDAARRAERTAQAVSDALRSAPFAPVPRQLLRKPQKLQKEPGKKPEEHREYEDYIAERIARSFYKLPADIQQAAPADTQPKPPQSARMLLPEASAPEESRAGCAAGAPAPPLIPEPKPTDAGPTLPAAGAPTPEAKSEWRARVDCFIDEVFRQTIRRITRADIWRVAGYKEATQFERFQRNKGTPRSESRFKEILSLEPAEFLERLKKLGAEKVPTKAKPRSKK